MLVSVLMPTFNVAAYVGEAIKSILGQTWRDLELLVQDDGSTDRTLAVTRELAQSDARVRVLEPFAVNRGNRSGTQCTRPKREGRVHRVDGQRRHQQAQPD